MKISKPLIVSALLLSLSSAATAAPENYKFDASHTAITWQVSHLGFSFPTGKFMNVEGVLVLDEEHPENATINVNIPVALGESGVPKLDDHLKSADFFDTGKFPTANFQSTKVEVTDKTHAKVTGNLTLHGVTKPVVLDVTLNKIDFNKMFKKKVAGFSATTTIKRSEFGMTTGIPAVSDDVKLTIEVEANKVD